MILAATIFSILASMLVAAIGRREPKLSFAALLLLLLMPFLGYLPKWEVLPTTSIIGGNLAPSSVMSVTIFGIWLVGFCLVFANLLLSSVVLKRWRKESELLEEIRFGGGRLAELRMTSFTTGPVATGVFRPTIYVPACWLSWKEEIRNIILAHEIAHLRRRDPLWRVMSVLVCAIHWFNPLVWWLARRQHFDAEFACDQSVVRSGVNAKHYARVLCDIASGQSVPMGVVSMAGDSQLHARMKRLFLYKGTITPIISVPLILGIGVLALLLSIVGKEANAPSIPASEIELRLNADPFPGN